MSRPTGVVLSCIVLGLAACMLLMMAAGSLVSIAIVGHMPLPATPDRPAPDPALMASVMRVVMIGSAVFYTVLAAWAISTLVGVARLRNWARISIMIIGGGLAVIGVLGALGMLGLAVMENSVALPPQQSPAIFRTIMLLAALFWLAIGVVGVWWLAYFARRRTRDAFLAANASFPQALPYPQPPSPYAASSYQVASYIGASEPGAFPVAETAAVLEVPRMMASAQLARPLAISIIGWLLIAGGILGVPCLFLPLPLFVFGIVMTGWTAHLTILSFAVISGLSGIGLLRLEKVAYFAALAYYATGISNTALFFLPSVRDRALNYQQEFMQRMSFGMPVQMFDHHTMGVMMLPSIVFGIALCLTAVFFLVRNRAAFDRPIHTQAAA